MSEPSWTERPWEDPAEAAKAKTDNAKTNTRIAVWAVVILAAVVGCTAVFASSVGHHEPLAPTDFDARTQCQEWVKEKLKSPSTADFSGQVVNGGPSSWTISGNVDSQNSFGATVRSSWTCDISVSGDQWTGHTQLIE